MANKKIVLFNGPPRSGKDTAAVMMADAFRFRFGASSGIIKVAAPLKQAVHALYGFSNRPIDYYENVKEQPTDDFMGLTPRQAYIALSEEYAKIKHGAEFFGKVVLNLIDAAPDVVVISDCGFDAEVQNISRHYGAENVCLIRMHRSGKDFGNDSRNYVSHNEPHDVDLFNDGTLDQLHLAVEAETRRLAAQWKL